jgi:hypothetical protein
MKNEQYTIAFGYPSREERDYALESLHKYPKIMSFLDDIEREMRTWYKYGDYSSLGLEDNEAYGAFADALRNRYFALKAEYGLED